MSKTGRENHRRPANRQSRSSRPERRINVRSIRREPYDIRKLGRTAITQALAATEAEKAAEANEAIEATENITEPREEDSHDN